MAAKCTHPMPASQPMDIKGSSSSEWPQAASASSSLSTPLQGRHSLSSMRSLSGALPCLAVIRVMPAGGDTGPAAVTAGRGVDHSSATAAAATATPAAAPSSGGQRADGDSASLAAASVADVAGAAVLVTNTADNQQIDTADQQPGCNAIATESQQLRARHVDADHRQPDGNAAGVVAEGQQQWQQQQQPPVRQAAASGAQPDGHAPAAAAAERHLPARYTKPLLKGVLQLMGCKQRHAHKMSERLFSALDAQLSGSGGGAAAPEAAPAGCAFCPLGGGRWALDAPRDAFEQLLSAQLRSFGYEQHHHAVDLRVACSIQERRESVTVLLCGTSGTGKSTLASLLASRLGVSSILSTDSVRHMLRGFFSEQAAPLLWVSTYQAGDCVRDADVTAGSSAVDAAAANKRATIKGYKAQSQLVMDNLTELIAGFEARRESIVIEGVHLAPNAVMRLMAWHPSVVPFLVYISNEAKHRERFAVRAKHMTLDPAGNRYIKYIRNIRTIQEYLARRADRHSIPKVDNTNVDRSVATIHATLVGTLRRRAQGEPFFDPRDGTARAVAAEFAAVRGDTWSSKDMLQLIRRKSQGRTPPSLAGLRLAVTMPPLREGRPFLASQGSPDERQQQNGAFACIASGRGSPSRSVKAVQLRNGGDRATAAMPAEESLRQQRRDETAASHPAAAAPGDSESGTRIPAPARIHPPIDHPLCSLAVQPVATHGRDGAWQQPRSRLSNDGSTAGGGGAGGPGSASPPADSGSADLHGHSHAGASDSLRGSSAAASPLPPLQQQSPRGRPGIGHSIGPAANNAANNAADPLLRTLVGHRRGQRRSASFAGRITNAASPRLAAEHAWGVERSGHSGVSLGGGSTSAPDTDADLESHYRSGDGSEAAAVRGWSTEMGSVADSGSEGSDVEGGSRGSGRVSSPGT